VEARERIADRLLAEPLVQDLDLQDLRAEGLVGAREVLLDAPLLRDVLLDRDEMRDRARLVHDGRDRLLFVVLAPVLAPVDDRARPSLIVSGWYPGNGGHAIMPV
jgi:hypothetical protein